MSEENAQAGEETLENTGVADQFAEADAKADPNAESPPGVEEIAARMGWVPKDKFRGDEAKWKPADRFILDGKDIQERQSRELKSIKETVETISKTSGAILQERLNEEVAKLARQHQQAVEQGDPEEAFRTANEIIRVKAAAEPAKPTLAPETQAWTEKNARIMSDPLARERAIQICNVYAANNPSSSPQEQLAYTEQNMRREFPHLFDDKPPAQVNGSITRNNSAPARNGKSVADLPREAKEHAADLVERGMIASIDDYAKHYFAEIEKRK